MKWNLEVYKCAVLTVIAVLLAVILWQMPPQPITMEKVRAAKMKRGWQSRVPLVYVQDGSISIDAQEPIPVEVQNEVTVEIEH